MKFFLATVALMAVAFVLVAADGDKPGTLFVGHDEMNAKLKTGGAVTRTPTYSVSASHRDKAGQVEVHVKETDVFYVTDGQATFVMGGEMVGGKLTRPNQYLGDDIKGGETHEVSKGDVVVVPAGTPHWFKAVPGEVSYFVVKVIQE